MKLLTKQNLIQALVTFCFILIGAGLVLGFRSWQVKNSSRPFIPQPGSFQLEPPRQALTGQIISKAGDVRKNTRDDSELKPVDSLLPVSFIEGETIKTDAASSAKVVFESLVTFSVGPNTEVVLSNTQPQGFLTRQVHGSVTYQVLDTTHSTSVRAMNTLVVIQKGTATVTVDANTKTITVTSAEGQTQFAVIDKENETQVYTLSASQSAVIDDGTRQVELEVGK